MFNTIDPAEKQAMLTEKFGHDIITIEKHYDVTVTTVKLEKLKEVITHLKDSGFTFLTSACGIHFPDAEEPFGMIYHLHHMPRNLRIRIKAFTKHDPPHFPTMTDIFPSANWMEREAYDFYGFRFDGHPHLRRILNVDDMEGFPLRKEFPLEDQNRYDKDDKMFGR